VAGCSGQVRRRVCRPYWSGTHNGFRFAAYPLSGDLGGPRFAAPVNRYSREFESVQPEMVEPAVLDWHHGREPART